MTDTTNTNNSNPGWVTPNGNPAPSSSNLANKDLGSMARCTVGGTSYEVSMPFDGSEGKLITHQSSEYTAGKESAFQGSVIGSARTPGGNPVMDRKVSSRDMVSLPGGGTTRVAAAVHAGLLVANPDGTYSDAPAKVDLKNPAEEARKGAPKEAGKGQPENAEFRIGDEGSRLRSLSKLLV